MLTKWSSEGNKYLCAHNGKDFDFPFMCRRFIVHAMTIPNILDLSGKRPWEIPHLDTMEMWKFGEYRNFTSLNLLAQVLGIPTPKDDMDGSMVHEIYWKDSDLMRIANYCQKDVITVVQVYLRLNNEGLISQENIEIK
jgi:predicted PolB exonuclease-like 3'-5' exonuclease